MAEDESLLSRIEDASLNASAPLQQRWLDGWMLRYCPGKARRSRCINALATGRLPLDQKLALAADLYRQSDVPMIFRITRFTQPVELDAQLHAQGWYSVDPTRVLVLQNLPSAPSTPAPASASWMPLAAADYAEAVGQLRGSPAEHRRSHAQRLAESPVPYQGWAWIDRGDDSVLACGQSAQEAELVGLYDVHTRDDQRGKGLATALCERLLSQAASNGAKVAYLQVDAANAPALRVYERLGFVAGYTYHYREAPAPAAP